MTAIPPATSSLTKQPEELLLHCFSFLNEKDLGLTICQVSKAYNNMGNQDILWESLIRKKFAPLSYSLKPAELTWKIFFKEKHLQKASPKRTYYFPCRNYHLTACIPNTFSYYHPEKPT